MWYFSTEAYQIHAGQCLLIFLKAGHRIHPGGLNGGVPEDIRQSNHILFHTVEGEGEQMPQIMRKNLVVADIGMETQLFHRFPDIAAIQWLIKAILKILISLPKEVCVKWNR